MAGKIKCFIALMIVMCLIYVQQSFVIYAGEKETDLVQEQKEQEKEPDKAVTEEKDEAGDAEGGEEEEKEVEDTDEKEDEDIGSDQEEKPPVEEEKPPVEEEEKEIEKYEITIPKENGEHDYYTKKPEIVVRHISEAGITKYCLKHGDKKVVSGILEKKGDKAIIENKNFSEGKNMLYVWMEDEDGNRLDKYELKKDILIDTKAPEIQMSAPEGFDAWYQGQVRIHVSSEDSVSKVDKISCIADGKLIGSTERENGEFVINQSSSSGKGVDITVIAKDKAGNKSERIKTVYIDSEAPKVEIRGIKNYTISGKTVNIVCEIDEENILQEFFAQIEWENTKGKKRSLSTSEWKINGMKKIMSQKLKKDGIYNIKVQAKDMSGHVSVKNMQVIVDKTNPVIRYVEELDGQYLKSLKWAYPTRMMIYDFTTYTYEMKVDGQLYHMGKKIDSEGKHKMTVKAVDAAGNRAQAQAEFVIDHTSPEIIFRNVKDGKEYKEECIFQVELAREEDTIEKIQINGESQKIYPGRKTYEYALHECKNYEIKVRAKDKAGNEAEKTRYFSIVPKETLAKKITKPVRRYLGGIDSSAKDTSIQQENKEEKIDSDAKPQLYKVAGIGIMGILIILSGLLYYRFYRQNGDNVTKRKTL